MQATHTWGEIRDPQKQSADCVTVPTSAVEVRVTKATLRDCPERSSAALNAAERHAPARLAFASPALQDLSLVVRCDLVRTAALQQTSGAAV